MPNRKRIKKNTVKRTKTYPVKLERVVSLRPLKNMLLNSLREAQGRTELIHAPEDVEIERLGERIGYGALMDGAMRIWLRKYGGGAFLICGCYDVIASMLKEPFWRDREGAS